MLLPPLLLLELLLAVPLVPLLPASGMTPPSGRSVPPQKPFVEPGTCTHGRPVQQSALFVHSLPCCWQEPLGSHLLSMHGLPQQSALVEHSCPVGTFVPGVQTKFTARQRGMPSESREQHASGVSLQKPLPGTPPSANCDSQQLFEVPPHAPVNALQTSPGRRHCADVHRPRVSPEAISQVFGSFG